MQNAQHARFVVDNIAYLRQQMRQPRQFRGRPEWASYIASLITTKKIVQPIKPEYVYRQQHAPALRHRTYDFGFISTAFDLCSDSPANDQYKLVNQNNESVMDTNNSILSIDDDQSCDSAAVNLNIPAKLIRIVSREDQPVYHNNCQMTPKDFVLQKAPFSTIKTARFNNEVFSPQQYVQPIYRGMFDTPNARGLFAASAFISPFLIDDTPVQVFDKPPRPPSRK